MTLKQALEIAKELRPDCSIFVSKELRHYAHNSIDTEPEEVYCMSFVNAAKSCDRTEGKSLEHCLAKIRAEIAPATEKNEE